jgi:curli production assembly/transport component CsgG
MRAYFQEKKENQDIDVLGRVQHDRRTTLGIGLAGAAARYQGDLRRPQVRGAAELSVHYNPRLDSKLSALVNLGRFELGAGDFYRETFNYAEACGQFRLFPRDRFTPYLTAGAGVSSRASQGAFKPTLGHIATGLGIEILPTDRVGVTIGVDNRYFLTDRLDGVVLGKYYDYLWSGKVGIAFYIGRGPVRKSTPLLEAPASK